MKRIQFLGKRVLWVLGWFFLTSVAMASESVTYYHNDVAGTPVLATDASGAVVWKETYLPYGKKQTIAAASANNHIGFTGKPYDSATGLSYFGARYYDPLVGRFNGIDPNGFEEKNLHSFNRYAYANNNPYKFVDPDGRNPILIAMGFGALIGGGLNAAEQYYSTGAVRWGGLGGVIDAAGDGALFGMAGGLAVAGKSGAVEAGAAGNAAKSVSAEVKITEPYARPNGATTDAQRASVQGQPCVDCGATTSRQVADHKEPLVKEYYRTGTIDRDRMRSLDAVQPQCPACSARQGAEMSRFSRGMKQEHGLE